jgi:hypothetical protein
MKIYRKPIFYSLILPNGPDNVLNFTYVVFQECIEPKHNAEMISLNHHQILDTITLRLITFSN